MNATTTEPNRPEDQLVMAIRTKSEGYGRGTNESLWL